jgi:hypothetical protein
MKEAFLSLASVGFASMLAASMPAQSQGSLKVLADTPLRPALIEIGIKETKGVQLIGALPAELQSYQFYAAAPLAAADAPEAAKRFIAFLVSPAAKASFSANGVQ